MTGRYRTENPDIKLIKETAWRKGVNKDVCKVFLQQFRNGEIKQPISEECIQSALEKLKLKLEGRKQRRRLYIKNCSDGLDFFSGLQEFDWENSWRISKWRGFQSWYEERFGKEVK